MLPTEAFAEAVAFLRLFDLSALAVANALCSTLAVKASTCVRWEEFPGLSFAFMNGWLQVMRRNDTDNWQLVANVFFPSETAMAEFIAAAFPNCIFEDVTIFRFVSKRILDVIGRVAGSVVVKRLLRIPCGMNRDDSLNLVRKFRKVKVSFFIAPNAL